MKRILVDLLPDLMALHASTKSERIRIRIERYVERILEALIAADHETPP